MVDARSLLETYVATGAVMQLLTVDADGAPVVVTVSYASRFGPDRLWFTSHAGRAHSANIRRDPRVAGGICGPAGDAGRSAGAVSLTGAARELPTTGIDAQIRAYLRRWPAAADDLNPTRPVAGQEHLRLYEIDVAGWVLLDEEHLGGQPQRLAAVR